jgi:transketolase
MRKTCLDQIHELAKRDDRVVFVGSDLGVGTLDAFRDEMPERFFMEGVSEQNIIGLAAGLALEGYVPFVNTIATFLTRRCYEQIAVDLCMHNLPVRLIGNGGGLVYAPLGPTHLATEDIAIMRALPRMTIVAPSDAEEMKRFVARTPDLDGPCYIRLAKGGDEVISKDELGFEIGKAILLRAPGDCLFVTTGVATTRALQAAERLAAQGIDCGVLHAHTVKPLDEVAIRDWAGQVAAIVTVEEHTLVGGLGSAVAELLVDGWSGSGPALLRLGLPDRFPDKYGSQDELLSYFGLDGAGIAESVAAFLAKQVAA